MTLQIIDNWSNALSKFFIDIVYFDIEKALNPIDYTSLLNKLFFFRLGKTLLK